jgi:hypothetical protein
MDQHKNKKGLPWKEYKPNKTEVKLTRALRLRM